MFRFLWRIVNISGLWLREEAVVLFMALGGNSIKFVGVEYEYIHKYQNLDFFKKALF